MKRTILLVMAALFSATVLTPIAAEASSKGRRNTALALTAGAVYSLVKHKNGQALVLGAGSAYAWKRYNDSRRAEVRKRSYRSGYHTGYRRGYSSAKTRYAKSSRYHRSYVARR